MEHKSGFVNIIGRPNAGKSTLMNALVEENLSIITSKAQTTRHRIIGIVNGEDFQLVFSDTPGFIKPAYQLHKAMMGFIHAAIEDADLILLVIDLKKNEIDEDLVQSINKTKVPVFVILNKSDLVNDEKLLATMQQWESFVHPQEMIPVSALKGNNIDLLMPLILEKMPEHPPYYPKNELTDRPERFFIAEIIREKIFLTYKQEIPYSCEVHIESFKDELKIVKILANIFVNRKSQKPILIGKQGSQLKIVGTEARKDIEKFLGKKVYLELFVKVRENWRDDTNTLKKFGYQ